MSELSEYRRIGCPTGSVNRLGLVLVPYPEPNLSKVVAERVLRELSA